MGSVANLVLWLHGMSKEDIIEVAVGAHQLGEVLDAPRPSVSKPKRKPATRRHFPNRRRSSAHPRIARSFGSAVRTKRLEMGVTQNELNDLCGMKRGTWSAIERGIWLPRSKSLGEKINQAVGVDIEEYRPTTKE